MKKNLLTGIFILLLSVTLYSCKPSDEKLQASVNTALVDQPGITASVKKAVVTLTGIVESDEARISAETIAKGVKDIKSVINKIEVKIPEPAVVINPDDALKELISTGLASANFSDITVAINDGEVTLTGNVKKADLQKVMQIANESKPKKVINKLTIKK